MKTEGDFVLCFLHGYRYAQIAHFFRSLEESAPAARVAVFSQNLPKETVVELQLRGVEVIDCQRWRVVGMRNSWERFWPWARFLCCTLPTRNLRAAFAAAFVEPMVRRFLHYRKWLQSRHGVRRVAMVDVRDVFFQEDPFAMLRDSEDCLFFEEASRMRDCSLNCRWINQLYGEGAWQPYGDEKVLCAGTIVGTRAGLLRYLDVFVDGLAASRTFEAGTDQGIMNHIVRTGKLSNASVRRNGDGVWTGRTDGDTARIDEQGRVVLPDGSPVAVVHQFDRDPGLSERVGHSGANCAIR